MVVGHAAHWHNKEAIKGKWAALYFQPQSGGLLPRNKTQGDQMAQGHIIRFHNCHYC